jgi:dipeptidyl aminopeptidase/acylaminoacyl peptidase
MVGMNPSHIDDLVDVTGVQVSPDGTTVAFSVLNVDLDANEYRSGVWLGPSDGSAAPRPFTAGHARDGLPRWSPDSAALAFVSHREESGSQIMVIPVAGGGEARTVASWPEEITELAWSPDGARLAFVARDRDEDRYGPPGEPRKEKDMPPRRIRRLRSRLDNVGWLVDRPCHIFVVPATGHARPLLLTPGEHESWGLAWSPDSASIAFSSARHDSWDLDWAEDLWIAAADGSGEPRRLTTTGPAYVLPSFSPDGRRLAYVYSATPRDEPRHGQVGVLDLATGEQVELTTALDRNCAPYPGVRSPVWAGDTLLFELEDAGNVHVYRTDAGGNATSDSKPEPVVTGTRWVSAWDAAAGTVVFAASTTTSLTEVYGVDADGEHRLTDFTAPFAAKVEVVDAEGYLATSADGTSVECWAMPPVGAEPGRRYPTILNIHGGPFTQYGHRFHDEFQLQVGAGFGVVYCNPRGSSGYTEAWGRAIRWPEADDDPGSGWGGADYDDVMACIDEACRRFGWIDAERLGVMGGSYGGYMTSWIIGHTDRFAAACSERSCNNLLALERESDCAGAFSAYVGRTHLEDPEAYLRQSPITYVGEMTTPVLIVHSEQDLRCPISQAEELFVALRLLGRDPELVRFPGESHELSRSGSPLHRRQRAELVLEWFRDKLPGGAGPAGA